MMFTGRGDWVTFLLSIALIVALIVYWVVAGQ